MKILGLKITKHNGTMFLRYEGTSLTRRMGRHTLCRVGVHNKRGWILARANVTYCNRCVSSDEALEAAVSNRIQVVLPRDRSAA